MSFEKFSGLPRARQAAVAAGEPMFFDGKPCRKNHVAPKRVSNGCVECSRLLVAGWRAANPEARKEYYKKNKEKEDSWFREYYKNNKGRLAASRLRWREENREHISKKNAEFRRLNPNYKNEHRAANKDRYNTYAHTRRVRVAGDRLSSDILSRLYNLQGGRCACCGKRLGEKYHADHIMPLALGGRNIDSNVQLLRPRCNSSKGRKHPVEFMQQRGMLL